MDYLGTGILVVLMLILILAFLVEIYVVRQHNIKLEIWTGLVNDYIDGFNDVKTALNGNASILRMASEMVNDHDRILKIITIMVDLHSEALKINPKLREDLEKEPIDGFIMDIKDVDIN